MARDYDAPVGFAPYQSSLALAVVGMLALTIGCVDRRATSGSPAQETVPGTDLRLLAPLGSVEQIREFAWQSPLPADRHRVIVRLGSDVVWQLEVTGLKAAPPLNMFVRDVEYRWQVQALDREGHVRLTSPSQAFTVY